MLYDLTTLQREANNRYGFSAKRTLGGRAAAVRGAQGAHLSAYQLALPDDRHGRGDQADRRARGRAQGVQQGRRVRDRPRRAAARHASSTTRRSPTTTRSSPRAPSTTSRRWAPTTGASTTWRYGASSRSSIPRRCSRTPASRRPSTSPTAAKAPRGTCSARAASCCSCPAGAVSTTRSPPTPRPPRPSARRGGRGDRPAAAAPARRTSRCRRARSRSARKETKPPRRYSDASLLGAMETAGKLVDDDELREAMKDSGIGTPATRAAIIERLITVGYIERDGRALVATEKGLNVIRLLNEHALTSPGADRQLGAAPRQDRARRGLAQAVHERHRRLRAGDRQGARRDAQRRAHPARQARAVPGVRSRDRREPQGLLVLGARGSGLRLRDLEGQSRQDAAARGRARADQDGLHRAGGDGLSRAQRAQLPRAPGAQRRPTRANGASSSTSCGRKEGAKPPDAEAEAEAARATASREQRSQRRAEPPACASGASRQDGRACRSR